MDRVAVHAALADEHRIAIADALVMDDLSVGDLAEIVGVPSNLLAHHLGVLERAGVVHRQQSEGDGRRSYVTLCLDNPVVAASVGAPPRMSVPRVVFVCTSNSARSQMAASLFSACCEVPVASAGTHPGATIHERTLASLRAAGLNAVAERPIGFAEVARHDDLVVAVCDNAYEELTTPGILHWSVGDPARREDDRAFDEALATLAPRVGRLADALTAGAAR